MDIGTKIEKVDTHPDFWKGIFPTDVSYMFYLKDMELVPDRITDIGVVLSTAISANQITADPATGIPYSKNATGITEPSDTDYDIAAASWSLLFSQGFGNSSIPKKDLFTVSASFDGEWERALNPILQLEGRDGYPFDDGATGVFSTSFTDAQNDNYTTLTGTPDLSGDRQLLAMSFNAGFEYNNLVRESVDQKGIYISTKFSWAPEKMCSIFDGRAAFFKISSLLESGLTIYQSKDSRGFNNFSLLLSNESELRILTGSKVPKYAEELLTTIWNFEAPNSTFLVHDCVKLVYYGEQFFGGGFVPKVYLFLDMSYSGGKINNLDASSAESYGVDLFDNVWTGSYGLHFELQIFESLHVYYELGYVFLAEGGTGDYQEGFNASEPVKIMISVNF